MIIQDVLSKTIQFFKDKKLDSPRLDAEILISDALGLQRIELYTNFNRPLSEEEIIKCRENVRRRSTGEPVAYITGKKAFFRHEFAVTPDVLIPRPETELIIEEVLKVFPDQQKTLQILDIGTGSGVLVCSLATEYPEAKLMAMDISPGALAVAQKNAQLLGVDGRVEFILGDASEVKLAEALQMDVIVSNPPYIANNDPEVAEDVRKFEPSQALFAEDEGLFFIKRWLLKYGPRLKDQGLIIFEIGNKQGPACLEIFKNSGFLTEVKVIKDLAGHDRFIRGVKHG